MRDDHNDGDGSNDDEKGKRRYKVGHGKPPKEHQFKKGRSGNPRGRKPRERNASTLLRLELDKLVVVRDGIREIKISKREALMTSLVNDAIKNKARARSDLFRLLDLSPPPEPFAPTDDDDAALDEYLRRRSIRPDEPNDDEDGSGGEQA